MSIAENLALVASIYGLTSRRRERIDDALLFVEPRPGPSVPRRTAAGNSADDHYNSDIYAWSFEVGVPRRNAANTNWSDVGFTPPFAEA